MSEESLQDLDDSVISPFDWPDDHFQNVNFQDFPAGKTRTLPETNIAPENGGFQ